MGTDAPIGVKRCSCSSVGVEPGVVADGEFGVVDDAAFESCDGVDRAFEVFGDGFHRKSGGLPAQAEGVDGDGGLWVEQGVVDLAGDVPLQAADDVTLGQSLGGAPGDVIHGAGILVGNADQHDAVDRGVGLPVASAVDAVP